MKHAILRVKNEGHTSMTLYWVFFWAILHQQQWEKERPPVLSLNIWLHLAFLGEPCVESVAASMKI